MNLPRQDMWEKKEICSLTRPYVIEGEKETHRHEMPMKIRHVYFPLKSKSQYLCTMLST